jgi:ligand-binding sensor domain-containing protein/DNA-binding CsgD family transcriptional regulator
MQRLLALSFFIFSSCSILLGQVKSIGIAYVKNFTKPMYKAHPKNLAIIQDAGGIMYFGNGDGLLQFDGTSWSLLRMPNKSAVISLCKDPSRNRIYVGAQGEFGFVESDSIGLIRYTSISKTLPKTVAGFGDIWKISFHNDRLVAIASNMVMILDHEKNWTIIQPQGLYFPAFEVRNKIFVYEKGRGLFQLDGNKLNLVNEGDVFSNKWVSAMVPYHDKKIVIGTEDGELFIYDGYRIVPWQNASQDFLLKNKIVTGLALSDGSIALGTLDNGLLVIDSEGKPMQHINSLRGLQSSSILAMYCDNNGNLWLGLENGIDYVELNSPFTYLNEQVKLYGAGYASAVYDHKLYLGTSHGLYFKDWLDYENPMEPSSNFKLVENTFGQTWNLNNKYDELLLAHNRGSLTVKGDKAFSLDESTGSWMFLQWDKHPQYLLEGKYSKLCILEKDKSNQWVSRNCLPKFRESFRIMEEDQEGNIWLSHPHKGVYKLTIAESLDKFDTVKFYNAAKGFPSDFNIYVSKVGDKIIFLTEKGVYHLNKTKDRVEPDPQFEKIFGEKPVTKFVEDFHGNIWYVSQDRPGKLIKHSNGYEISDEQFGKLDGKLVSNFEHINPIDDRNVLFGTDKGFVHYDPSRAHKTKIPFYVHIRKIEDTNHNRLIAGDVNVASNDTLREINTFTYNQNALQFTFTCTSYQDFEKNQYQYKLEGFDRNWSEWTSRTQKEYTNLPEGKYRFKVRARNFNNEISSEVVFAFRINAPIYRSQVAYFLYCIVALLAVAGIVKVINLRKEKQFKQQQVTSERKITNLENEKLENEVNYKRRELASLALNITSKNEMIDQIKSQLKSFSNKLDTEGKTELTQIIKLIDNNSRLDNDWKKFEFYFDQVHSNFLKQLREKYPDLTISQMKLCAYLRMNLSTKEIATLMNISVAGIEKSRYRLRRKFTLEHDEMLSDFIQKI